MKTTTKTTQATMNVNMNAETVNANVTAQKSADTLIKKEIINKVSLTGHLGNDPEITVGVNGMKKAKFRMATNRYFKNKQGEWQSETTWHNVVAWAHLAVIVEQQFKRGTAISLDGRLNYRMYDDSKGVQRFYTEVVASTIVAVPAQEKATVTETQTIKIAA